MSGLADLIARIEAASGPSGELNALIWLETRVKWSDRQYWHWRGCQPKGEEPTEMLYALERAPNFSGSLDTALTILPSWASYELTRSAADKETPFTRCRLWDWRRSPTMLDPGNEWKAEGNRLLSLNVCIAALKARGERS